MKTPYLFFAAAPFAAAVCPNSCSGQGDCVNYDQCTCNANWRGSDCSQRVCPFANSWMTTPKGDLNFDGDRVDYTIYNADTRIASGTVSSKLITQELTGGDWESWPAYAANGEGHFYMECANRGLCNRETGECECFPGYEGASCNRMVCPNDCSGKGVCQTTSYLTKYPSDLVTSWYDTVSSTNAYGLWDGEMAMACQCDPGYTGPDCSIRQCPVGDDILTHVDQVYETQFIDIYTTCEGTGASSDCATASATTLLGGSIRLTYTDFFGEKYTTDAIDGVAAFDGASAHALATNAEAALKAIPNNVFSDDITVKAAYCEVLDPERHLVTAGLPKGGTEEDTAKAWRALGSTCQTAIGDGVYMGGKLKVKGQSTGTGALTAKEADATGLGCTNSEDFSLLTNPLCIRLVVNFQSMPGDHADFDVDFSEVTYNGFTNDQLAASSVTATVSDRIAITTATAGANYVAPSTVKVASAAADSTVAASTITFGTGDTLQGDATNTFYVGSTIEIWCGHASGVGTRSLGEYTVASIHAANKIITISEAIPASTRSSDCATAKIVVAQVSHVLVTGNDASTATNADTDTSVLLSHAIDAYKGSNANHKFHIGVSVSTDAWWFHSEYDSSAEFDTSSDVSDASSAIVIFNSVTKTSIGKNAAASSVGTILGSNDVTDAAAISNGALTASSVATYYIEGAGTHESVECGARGLCDTEAGECKCFPGYIGLACEFQSAISM